VDKFIHIRSAKSPVLSGEKEELVNEGMYGKADGVTAPKKWSWREFRFVDSTPYVTKLHGDLFSIFRADPDVQVLTTERDSPFHDAGGEPGTSP
jgi:hypothetical protein